jgi:pantetheine-phosphate adenylyltransferase
VSRIAIFPGSFDPVTVGHVSIVQRALPLFETIIVAMGVNSTKKAMFPIEQRIGWLKATFSDMQQVKVVQFEGLTVDLCRRENATFILRGIRNGPDHDHERAIALMNRAMGGIETVFLPAEPAHAHISSTIVRELIGNKADVSAFVPKAVRP